MHANRPDLLENGLLILHDNARPNLGKDVRELLDGYSWEVLPRPPYSPEMSPPDFDLFPKSKINTRGMRFSTLEDPSASVTQHVRQLNCSRDLTGIMDLPKHWDAFIRQKGDYIEGLSNAHSEISRKRDYVFKQTKVGNKVQYFSYKLTYLFFDIVALSFSTFFPK